MITRRPRLSPRGTARERFEPPATGDLTDFFRSLARSARAHDLGDDSLYLAEEVVRMTEWLGESERQALAMALLASMIAVRQGCTRLPLGGGVNGYLGRIVAALIREGELDVEARKVVREIDRLASGSTFDQMIGATGEVRPLIAAHGHLYQHRMYACEQAFVARVRERIAGAEAAPPAGLTAAVDQVATTVAFELSDEQRAAVARALSGRLTIVTGGPGTGKTAIVLSILRAARRLGIATESIAVAAPTGKAVNRIAGAMRAGLEALPSPDEIDRELLEAPPEPRTLHRLLGYRPQLRDFRHHENNPVAAELVILDEASMVDLSLMERTLRALRPDARLVLLGDADQLPSVDAGAVLRDLVQALPEQTCRLARSFRMDPSNPAGRAILGAAARVNQGEPPEPDGDAVTLVTRDTSGFLDRWYDERIAGDADLVRLGKGVFGARDGLIEPGDAERVAAIMAGFETSRLLTVTRRHPTGAESINRRLHQRTLERATASFAPDLYPGEPILMRTNDYERGLFNGDQGVVLRVIDEAAGARQQYRAVFPSQEGFRVFQLEALRAELELAYAMTVHKSQGSEFDHVALILPARDLPLLTRELLYTAITRARQSVTLVGTRALLRIAANRSIERLSGIREALML